jgi:hypothetical protein
VHAIVDEARARNARTVHGLVFGRNAKVHEADFRPSPSEYRPDVLISSEGERSGPIDRSRTVELRRGADGSLESRQELSP